MLLPTLLASLFLACQPTQRDLMLGGIQVNEAELETWLDSLQAEGLDTVALTDYAHQGDWDSDNLWWDEHEGIVPEMRGAAARGMKTVLVLRVALDHAFPRNRFLWHGMIMPQSEEQLAEWFRRYTRFCVRWAQIAEREGVDLLIVGSEMNALASTVPAQELPLLEEYFLNEEKQQERRDQLLSHEQALEQRHLKPRGSEPFPDLSSYLDERIATERLWAARMAYAGTDDALQRVNRRRQLLDGYWRSLVQELRQHYRGPMAYAANFDQYHEVGFWDELDTMGINAYFALRKERLEVHDTRQLYEQLVEGWNGVLQDIEEVRQDRNLGSMPVVFTELGYTARRHATIEPWAGEGFTLLQEDGSEQLITWQDQPLDWAERALAVRALGAAERGLGGDLLAGILWWKLSSHEYHLEIEPFLAVLNTPIPDPLFAELRRLESAAP